MNRSELTKLVKTYTNGEMPLEVYREQRRQIVNDLIDGPKPKKSNDPLDSFIASTPQKTSSVWSKKPSIYLTITGAALAIGIAAYLFANYTRNAAQNENSGDLAGETTAIAKIPKAQKLAEKFLASNKWNEESINQFILDWQILSPSERQEAQNTAWFTRFKSAIQNQLNEQKNNADKVSSLAEDLLTSLLVTVDPGHFIRQPFFTEESTTLADNSKIEAIISSQPTIVAGTDVAGTDVAGSDKELTVAANEVRAGTDTHKPAIAVKQKAVPAKAPHVNKIINLAKVNKTLSEFVQSFETGNLDSLMQLFSSKATTNHHTSAADIRTSYAELFQTTAVRELQFSEFTWTPVGINKIEGNGKYLAHLNPKGTNVDQVFSADVTIMFDNTSGSPVILGLFLNNQQFSTSLRQTAKTPAPDVLTPPPIEKEELRILLTNFVTSYNRGDIDGLMGLFSQEARTNDRSNIKDIRDDYLQLFQTTKSREIILTNVVWDISNNRAVANGFFEAKIRPKSSGELNVYKGKIRFSVTKFEGGILITQLLHNTK